VRVWDLASGDPVGRPFTRHRGPVNAVAVAELAGHPLFISGSDDQTVRVRDLASGDPVGRPFTRHRGPVNAVAVAELAGRPVVVSGSDDQTVWVWDPASGAPVGDPFTGHGGAVYAATSQTKQDSLSGNSPVHIGVGATGTATVSGIHLEVDGTLWWEQIAALEVGSNILALALTSKRGLIVAAELGIVAFDLPDGPSAVSNT
jgi:WD40 repeat protein